MLVDTHCHLTHERFREDLPDVLERAKAAGVGRIVSVASTADDAEAAGELASRHRWIRATAGIHPHEAESAEEGDLERIAARLGAPEVVAVGETGLDFHYDHSPRSLQRGLFVAHLELAHETGLPAVVHSRSADDDTAAILREAPGDVRGVLHCFAGGRRLMETALEAGWFISFTGLVTFGSYDGASLLRAVPRDRLMVETDGPYLAPVPKRGRRNEPAFVRYVCEAVAAHRGEDPEEVAAYTSQNAERFFGAGS